MEIPCEFEFHSENIINRRHRSMNKFNPNPDLKFRVIDTEDGKVYSPKTDRHCKAYYINPDGLLGGLGLYGDGSQMDRCVKETEIISASIGLTDSKGVEIYSGDVIEYKATNPDYPVGQRDTTGRKCLKPALGVIIWEAYKYTVYQLLEGEVELGSKNICNERKKLSIDFYNHTETNVGWNEYDFENLTVIGNIWQPEFEQYLKQLEAQDGQ